MKAKLTNRAEGLSGRRVGRVIDAGGTNAEGDREGRAGVLHVERVEHDGREVALSLGGAREVRELLLSFES